MGLPKTRTPHMKNNCSNCSNKRSQPMMRSLPIQGELGELHGVARQSPAWPSGRAFPARRPISGALPCWGALSRPSALTLSVPEGGGNKRINNKATCFQNHNSDENMSKQKSTHETGLGSSIPVCNY